MEKAIISNETSKMIRLDDKYSELFALESALLKGEKLKANVRCRIARETKNPEILRLCIQDSAITVVTAAKENPILGPEMRLKMPKVENTWEQSKQDKIQEDTKQIVPTKDNQCKDKKTNWWSIISFFLFIVVCFLSYNLYDFSERITSLDWQLNKLEAKLNNLSIELEAKEQEVSTLQEELFLIRENGFGIHSIEFGNNDYYGNTLTRHGRSLYSSKMRYLMPRLIYYATGTKNVTFQYKIFNPDGTLNYNSNYSEEFTGRPSHVTLYAGKKNIVELKGWGHSDKSTYQPGTYSIEIWYDGKCIKKQSFEILQ